VDDNGTETDLGELELALASVAFNLGKHDEIPSSLARPPKLYSIKEACAVIAKEGSPPLQVSVARDLARAFTTDELEPLLALMIRASGIEPTGKNLKKKLEELRTAGPTVSFEDFPSERR
jgi:hypothetical protein